VINDKQSIALHTGDKTYDEKDEPRRDVRPLAQIHVQCKAQEALGGLEDTLGAIDKLIEE